MKTYTYPKKAEKKVPLQVEKEKTAKLTEDLLKDKKAHEDADYAKAKANAAQHNSSKIVQKIEAEAIENLNKITDEFKKSNVVNQTVKLSSEDLKKASKLQEQLK